MSENRKKWTAYFLELLVVIIGISIAFALENWSEKKRNTMNEINYLESLDKDISQDINEVQSILDSSKILVKNINELFGALYGYTSEEMVKNYHVTSAYSAPYFNSKDGTYISLLNSGTLRIIEDYELKSSIINLYNVHYDEILRQDDFIKNLVNNQIYPYMLSEVTFRADGKGITSLEPLKAVKAINMLGSYYNFLLIRIAKYEAVKTQCESVLKNIELELTRLKN